VLLEQIEEYIERAVIEGQLCTLVPGPRKSDVIKELELAGYAVVHHYDPRNKESWYTIKW
jgi:hypothetical protein